MSDDMTPGKYARLQAENAALRKEVIELQQELKALQSAFEIVSEDLAATKESQSI